jgi:hypothetical protein
VASLSFASPAISVVTQGTGAKPAECTLILTADTSTLPDIPTWTGSHGTCDAKYVPSNFR